MTTLTLTLDDVIKAGSVAQAMHDTDGELFRFELMTIDEALEHPDLVREISKQVRQHNEISEFCDWDALKYELNEIEDAAAVLSSHGPCFTGGVIADASHEWLDCGFNPEEIDAWCKIKVWSAKSASVWTIAGLAPNDVIAAAALLLENHPVWDYTDGCPIYSCCNGDTQNSLIVDAHNIIAGKRRHKGKK